jgi:hypothetical protein
MRWILAIVGLAVIAAMTGAAVTTVAPKKKTIRTEPEKTCIKPS